MEGDNSSSLLRYAASRAASNRFFLAGCLAEFSRLHGAGEDELARFLSCSRNALPRLALCRRPDPESPRFRTDVERIAAACDVQAIRLAQLIREVETMKALAEAGQMRQNTPEGLLAVARDDDELHPGDEESPEDQGGES